METGAYQRCVDASLERIADRLEAFEDVDCAPGDGLLTIEFEDGTRYVVNRQAAVGQLWLAAGARAWHYDWDEAAATWVDDRDGHRLWDRLSEVISAKLGTPVSFDDP